MPRLSFRTLFSLFLIPALFSISCGKKQINWIKVDPAFIPYISAYTGGIVSTATKIKIQLAQEVNSTLELAPFYLKISLPSNLTSKEKPDGLMQRPLNLFPNNAYQVEFYTQDILN